MAPRFLTFGDLRFDMSTRELVRVNESGATTSLPLGSRAADMLALFLQRPGDLVAKNEIMNAVWPNTTIEDSNLTVQISALRRALDAGRDGASAIATVPGRGYRFNLPVQEEVGAETATEAVAAQAPDDVAVGPSGAAAASADAPAASSSRRPLVSTRVFLAGGALLAVVVALVLYAGYRFGFTNQKDARAAIIQIYDRGQAAIRNGNFDGGIEDFSELIRLDPWNTGSYQWRSRARRYKGDYDGAIADAAKVIELTPESHIGYLERGHAYLAKGDFARAIADYDAALRLMAESEDGYLGRGRAYVFTGDMEKARADFQVLASLRQTTWALPVLWLGVVERRGGLPAGFVAAKRRLNLNQWPAALMHMLAGEIAPAQALAAADDGNPATRKRQLCQANFYAGEVALAQGTRDEAARLFRLAADGCSPIYIEQTSAVAELRVLDRNPPPAAAAPNVPPTAPKP